MNAAPTLFFCVGATKAGTSWLYDFLRGHPDCHVREVKELHFFDRHETGANWPVSDVRNQLERAKLRLASGKARDAASLKAKIAQLRALRALLQGPPDDQAYVSFLTEGLGDRRLVADVTPSYSLLSSARLAQMARLLPDVRFLYILRDPVERLWSHVRMIAKRRAAKGGAVAAHAASILDEVLAGREPAIATRSDYRGALERLQAAVDPGRLKVAFYEELLTASGITELCGFLGIADLSGDLWKLVHAGTALDLRPDQMRKAREWLAPQYDFVEKTMTRVPDVWHRRLTEV